MRRHIHVPERFSKPLYQDFVTATITQLIAMQAIEVRISGAKC